MPSRVTLEVTEGPIKGQKFAFEEHNTLIFGRDVDCKARLSEDDLTASRHHFFLEVNPPDARIRDLGSLNGTFVNESKYGGRKPHETPEDAANRQYPEVSVVDGDRIRVGETVFAVRVEVPVLCTRCGKEIPDASKSSCKKDSAVNFTCPQCMEKERQSPQSPPPPSPPIRCSQCGKDASKEVGAGLGGDYVCQSCRNKIDPNPLEILLKMLFAEKLPAFPGYHVGKELGRGGMGAVYLATREKDDKKVAIKIMLSKASVSEHARKHFQREIESTMKLGRDHPNIVTCYEQGSAKSGFFFVLEFCEGGDVVGLMDDFGGKLPVDVARPIMLQCLDGLAYAHENKYVHRDLKPQNILLTAKNGGSPKIADLGLAKNFDLAGFSNMTVTGSFAGTWDYMPKEQIVNYRFVKPNTDVWSMGATFYCMLTGMTPRDRRPGQDPAQMVLQTPAVPIGMRERSIPKNLADVIDKSLSFLPQDRYEDASAFRDALKKVL